VDKQLIKIAGSGFIFMGFTLTCTSSWGLIHHNQNLISTKHQVTDERFNFTTHSKAEGRQSFLAFGNFSKRPGNACIAVFQDAGSAPSRFPKYPYFSQVVLQYGS
jgi:hypothetical protein